MLSYSAAEYDEETKLALTSAQFVGAPQSWSVCESPQHQIPNARDLHLWLLTVRGRARVDRFQDFLAEVQSPPRSES